jgi:hypothetical protein
MGELQEQVNALSYLNIVVSWMSMQRLQDLKAGLVQEMRDKGDEEQKEMERIRDERAQLQEQYDTTLQQEREGEGRVEEVLKNKYEAEERTKKSL